MTNTSKQTKSGLTNILIGCALAVLWGLFAYRHAIAFIATKEWAYLLIAFSETLSAAFFLLRSEPVTVSTNPLHWVFGIAGTFLPFLFTPAPWGALPTAKYILLFGFILQVLGIISLNKSLAIVAAKRELKTSGMYHFVRHPLYASYLLIFGGYILNNTTTTNIIIYVMTAILLLMRIDYEEKHLSLDPAYLSYMQQVRYRVIPFVF